MNVHHLELFFYVAKHEGITEAVRKMPYGIQQPAVSGQILQLEKDLGVKLFHRRPFALTPAGEELYDFIYPFFSRLGQMGERLRGEESCHLRLVASAAALTHHLPDVLQSLRESFPDLRLTLKEMSNPNIEAALIKQEADVAVAVLHRKTGAGLKTVKLVDLPLAIAAPVTSSATTFREICSGSSGELLHPLISLPKSEPVAQIFQQGLTKRELRWAPSMEVNELGLILNYVSRGFGYGVAVDIPGVDWPEGVKKIKLPSDFPPLTIGALHTGDLKPLEEAFIALAKTHATKLRQLSSKKKN
ncbi:LysR family transcriptional regulator [Verrucomicrobiales bacterium]|nr:LysR family transcriptional regulator [Verrucomicrobiales bacterium]MDB4358653.1 LysR family transcriptional regulator [Verrucomicrobiales bacterium]